MFDDCMESGIDDTTYLSNKNTSDRVNPVGYYGVHDSNYFTTHEDYDALIRERVRAKDRKSRKNRNAEMI